MGKSVWQSLADLSALMPPISMPAVIKPAPIPEGAMRVAPGSDAVVWKVNPGKTGEL